MTADRIVNEAVIHASTKGVTGVTIGSIADALDMSKAGVIGPFGSKAELQRAVIARATEMFIGAIVTPAWDRLSGLDRLLRMIDHWTAYLIDSPFPNGCFFTAASCELDAYPGPLRDQLCDMVTGWRRLLRDQIVTAQAANDIADNLDPDDIVDTLVGLTMAANQNIQLLGDRSAADRARRLMYAAVGQSLSANQRRGGQTPPSQLVR